MESLLEKIGNSNSQLNENLTPYFKNSFYWFFYYAFCLAIRRVEGKFVVPAHLGDIAYRLEKYDRTSTVAARFHLKSTVAEGYVAWKLYTMKYAWNEWEYMSYTGDLGAYHTKRLNRMIDALPELFGNYKRLSDADSIVYFAHGGREFYCEPAGILSFKRGKHPNGMICDDILKDPQSRLDLSQLAKIEQAFFEEVEQMPSEELHVVGTPQAASDLFSKLETNPEYNCKRYPAEKDPDRKIALWENNPRFCWESLQKKRAGIGEKAYRKEFLCMPVHGADGYISLDQMNAMVRPRLQNYPINKDIRLKQGRTVVAGLDIGKKTHPSHLIVLADVGGKLVQIHGKFMDGWGYDQQIEYCKNAIKQFGILKLFYDNTRAEFELAYEQGLLAAEMDGVVFSAKLKYAMATTLDQRVTAGTLQLIDDPRQTRQILSVDCDLQAPETQEGHGDAFFSLCLAVHAFHEVNGVLYWSP